jgi:hypothetical protein
VVEVRAARPEGFRAMTYGRAAAGGRAPLGAPRAEGALQRVGVGARKPLGGGRNGG